MKKNFALRAASCLAIATLLTTSVVSGTYAKYVTKGGANDTARVAKFGVEVKAEGELFSKTYYEAPNNSPNGDSGKLTVVSSNGDKLVAPGTNNGDGLKISVSGTPEVDVKVTFEVPTTYKDIFLADGVYTDVTGENDKFKLDDTYYPIKYTLTTKNGGTNDYYKLSEVANVLNNMSDTYSAGTDLESVIGTITLTWEWEYGVEKGINVNDPPVNDKADTVLGDLAANSPTVQKFNGTDEQAGTLEFTDGTDYNLNTSLTIDVIVTQVD